jgi:hypothetical protein
MSGIETYKVYSSQILICVMLLVNAFNTCETVGIL